MALGQSDYWCSTCGARSQRDAGVDEARAQELFQQSLALGNQLSDEWLRQACGGNEELMREVVAMLRARWNAETKRQQQTPPATPPPLPAARTATATVTEASGVFIGSYRLIRELGRGGMGVVYLAVRDDGTFRKQVALKLLLRDQINEQFVLRFKQERQVLAALDHPNIARILDGGDAPDGSPYYVMEYVEGLTLDRYCDEQRLSLTARIKIFQQICQAVDYLHQNSVVHRDLKPSNILVTSSGNARLLDFGIAKVVGAAAATNPELTVAENRPMTPNYASPEQISGGTIKASSDIYALGVILYILLTGRPPFQSFDDKLAKFATRQDPPPPSANIREDLRATPESTAQLRRAMMGDLDSIVLKALRYDPKDRYESAAAFSDDLQKFIDGLPVKARQITAAGRWMRAIKRKPVVVAAVIAFVALAGFGAWQWYRAETHAAEARQLEAHLRSVLADIEARPSGNDQVRDVHAMRTAFETDYAESAARQPGKNPSREALIERGERYLDQIRSGKTAISADLGIEIAEAYEALAVLRAETGDKDPAHRSDALRDYQKAADVINACAGLYPNDSRCPEELQRIGARMQALGGSVASAPPPQPEPKPEAKAEAPPQPKPASKPVVSPPSVVKQSTPVQQTTQSAPPQVTPKPAPAAAPVPSVDTSEAEELLAQATAKVASADQAIGPIRENLTKSGGMLSADTSAAIAQMHAALERGKRNLAAGKVAEAKESFGIAEAFAGKILKLVGR